jgi:RNA polymerase sigma factor (sigma-70 family)
LLEQIAFRNMMDRVRQGDQDAATVLVKHFGPKIRKAVHKSLFTHCLGREVDAHDISQSVFAHFFLHNVASRSDLDDSDKLARFLVTMARNKVRDYLRMLHAGRRDRRRLDAVASDCILNSAIVPGLNPSQIVAGREIIQELYRRLNKEERILVELRSHGLTWETIAAKQGGSAEALRKKLTRALIRVSRQLGFVNPV